MDSPLMMFHQKTFDILGNEDLRACPPDSLQHCFIETSSFSVDADTLAVARDVLKGVAPNHYIGSTRHRVNGFPNIAANDVPSYVAAIGFAGGRVVFVRPNDSERQTPIQTSEKSESAKKSQV